MTNDEFQFGYKRLASVYPHIFGNPFKEQAVAGCVKDMEFHWWNSIVMRIILSSNPKIDIADLARAERLSKDKIKHTMDLIQASENIKTQISQNGLENALKDLNAKNLSEAVLRGKNKT